LRILTLLSLESVYLAPLVLGANGLKILPIDPSLPVLTIELAEGNRFERKEWSDVQKFRDGLIPDEEGQAPLTTAMEKVAPPSWRRSAFRHKVWPTASYMDRVHAAPFFELIAVRDRYDLQQTLRAGRIWQRAHLLATTRNVAGQPLNQIVELVDHQRALRFPISRQQVSRLSRLTTQQHILELSYLTGFKSPLEKWVTRSGAPFVCRLAAARYASSPLQAPGCVASRKRVLRGGLQKSLHDEAASVKGGVKLGHWGGVKVGQ
jgi:hypothetical protein